MNSPTPPDGLRVLRYGDVPHPENPTGEELLDRGLKPFKVWAPNGQFLVLGNSQTPEIELHAASVTRDGIPVFKRNGGGGAVLLSPGCLCVGLRFTKIKGRGIQEYFELGSGLIQRVVRSALGADLESRGISDLALGPRKVVGSSLYMPREFVLYLASILVNPDLEAMERYLAHPSREPEYRVRRGHCEFLTGLKSRSGDGLIPESLIPFFKMEMAKGLWRELDWELCGEEGVPSSPQL